MLDSEEDAGPMYIPVLGPLITIGTASTSAGGTTPLIFDAVAQGAGVAMFIAGMASSQQVLKYQLGPSGSVTVKPDRRRRWRRAASPASPARFRADAFAAAADH